MDKIKVDYMQDADGYQVDVINLTTKKQRTFRFDNSPVTPGVTFVKYDLLKKPTTRTHELVTCNLGFDAWVDDNAEVLAQSVM